MATALFLGRFQPPHFGHLLTICGLAERYDSVVVGVTESEPSVMPVPAVIELMQRVLTPPQFRFVHVRGSVELGTAVIDVDFDVCCSGNPAVIDRMAARGYRTEFIPRSLDALYSGTRERSEYVQSAIARAVQGGRPALTEFALVETSSLRPIEKVNPTHFSGIETELFDTGAMHRPLIVDRHSLAVLDGSHRYAFLVKHGFRFAPVLLCDYDDESIFVGNHLAHRFAVDERKWISKQHVRATAISGNLYEPRTTRHFFPFRKRDHPVSLATLEQGEAHAIANLIARVSPEQEAVLNQEYIDELAFELSLLQEYMTEQADVRRWLQKQNAFIAARGGPTT